MSETSPSKKRPADVAPEPPPGSELAVFLWVVAALIAVLEVAWWWSVSIYS